MSRQTFVLTPTEFAALGGTEPPEDYVPGERRPIGSHARWGQPHGTRGVVPTIQPDSFMLWQGVAERCGVKVLSIRWPDPYFPDFTAVPLDDA